jgi:6-phosphofructokinase 2
VIVDTSGEALEKAFQEGVYMIKPNIGEFRTLAGKNIKEESQIKTEAGKMVNRGNCQVLVISFGAAGALMVTKDSAFHIRPPAVPIVSKVGAGDSMVAGIVLSLARGKPLKESVMFGVASGTAAVMTPGTQLCRKQDTLRLFETMISEN